MVVAVVVSWDDEYGSHTDHCVDDVDPSSHVVTSVGAIVASLFADNTSLLSKSI